VRALFVRLPGLRQVARHWFGGYVAHDLEGVQGDRAQLAARRVEAYYRHLDDFLAQLWAQGEGPRLLAVVSPYGAGAPSGWRRATSFGRLPIEGVLSARRHPPARRGGACRWLRRRRRHRRRRAHAAHALAGGQDMMVAPHRCLEPAFRHPPASFVPL
jgi:hypothetical protein